MGNLQTMPLARGAWVGKCPACGTCCSFSKFPASGYAGQQVVRVSKFNPASVACSCGRRFQTFEEDLLFVTIASLSIQRSSPESFLVEQSSAGAKTDLGEMSETGLWKYLNACTLIDIVPSQVLTFLNVANALDMDMVLAVIRPPTTCPPTALS